MKKTALFSLLNIVVLSTTSDVFALFSTNNKSATELVDEAFPQSFYTTKCSRRNANLDWGKIAEAETKNGEALIQQKISERVIPCLNDSNPNYSRAFEENCKRGLIGSNTKTKLCADIIRKSSEKMQEQNRQAIETNRRAIEKLENEINNLKNNTSSNTGSQSDDYYYQKSSTSNTSQGSSLLF